jgi:hypothetical protein
MIGSLVRIIPAAKPIVKSDNRPPTVILAGQLLWERPLMA